MIAGKTGTTESYGDAWFVGWTKEYTVAVWVGYPDEFKPMETEFQGEPVAGGTFPAGDLEDVHGVAAEDRPAAQEGRRRRHRQDLEPTPTPGGAGAGTRRPPRPPRRRRRRRRRRGPTAAERTAPTGGTAPPQDATPPRPGRHAAAAGRDAAGRTRRRRPSRARRPTRRRRTARGGATGVAARPHRRAGGDPPRGTARAAGDAPAAPSAGRTGSASARAAQARGCRPGGQGRETSREPSAQKRHGSSAAFVIPIRGPVTYGSGAPSKIRTGPAISDVPFSASSIPSAWVSFPGPLHELAATAAQRASPRRPRSGSSARIRTAAPTPSGSHTAFSSAWMP